MVAQFGRSIFDSLVALELVVKDSHEDAYALQFEPAYWIGSPWIFTPGFHSPCRLCIDDWRFHVPPSGFNLEEDIAPNWRLACSRGGGHTGFQFFAGWGGFYAAYAVQLHLKQISTSAPRVSG